MNNIVRFPTVPVRNEASRYILNAATGRPCLVHDSVRFFVFAEDPHGARRVSFGFFHDTDAWAALRDWKKYFPETELTVIGCPASKSQPERFCVMTGSPSNRLNTPRQLTPWFSSRYGAEIAIGYFLGGFPSAYIASERISECSEVMHESCIAL